LVETAKAAYRLSPNRVLWFSVDAREQMGKGKRSKGKRSKGRTKDKELVFNLNKIPQLKQFITNERGTQGLEISPKGVRAYQEEYLPGYGSSGRWHSFAEFMARPGLGHVSADHPVVIQILGILKRAQRR